MDSNQPEQRTSLYLVNRAEALRGALQFFAKPHSFKFDLQLQFLAQLDFWEWELENLIYSFTNRVAPADLAGRKSLREFKKEMPPLSAAASGPG